MAVRLNAYIMFPGTARAAMETYQRILGGELTVVTFGQAGAEGVPDPDAVMHAALDGPDGFALMASDTPPGMEHRPGNDIALSLSGDEGERLRGYWEQLAEGGSVTIPLEKQMWGDEFGQLTDRFGVSWMVDIGSAEA